MSVMLYALAYHSDTGILPLDGTQVAALHNPAGGFDVSRNVDIL